MVRFSWDAETEAVVRPELEEMMLFHAGIVPSWCQMILIGFDSAYVGGAAMTVRSHPEYRWARITICPSALKGPAWAREETIVHELFHLPLEPMHIAATDLRGFAVAGKGPGDYLEEVWRRAWEGAVCDLTTSYLKVHRLHQPPENGASAVDGA